MATGFTRQGDWQTGYVQRNVPTKEVKDKEALAIQLAKRADEETKKRVQSAKQLEAEAARIFQVQTGLDKYEAQKAADMSATFKDFMTKTVTSIAKGAQDQARAEGDAAAILEDENETEEVFYDQTGKQIKNEKLQEIQATSEKNLDIITKVEKQVAAPLEKVGERDKANKARGLFSSAYKFGYENRRAALAVDGFAAKLKAELNSSELLLQRKGDEEPWMLKDAEGDKDKLRFASAYLLGEFIDENRGSLGDITVAEVLGKPAKKVISKELKTRYDAIDFEFKENQIAAITNHLGASMEMLPGATSLWKDITTLEDRLRPYLTATATKSKGALLKETISNTFTDVISRSANPQLVKENFLAVASKLKLDTSMGAKTLAEIDKSLFSEDAINKIYTEEMSKRYSNDVKGQKQSATLAIINKSNEIAEDIAKTGNSLEDYTQEMLTFKASLIKAHPYAVGEITNLMEKFFIPTQSANDTIRTIEISKENNGGVVKGSDLDNVNLDIAKEYLETNNIEVMDEPYTETHKDHIKDREKDTEKMFDKIEKQVGVTLLTGSEREAADQFNWEVKIKALKLVNDAKANGVVLTYSDAYDQALGEMQNEVTAGMEDPKSRWYLTIGEGFNYFNKDNVDPFKADIPDVETWTKASLKANGRNGKKLAEKTLWIDKPERLNLLANGYSSDPLVRKLARVFGLTDSEFVNAQKALLPEGTFTEEEVEPDFVDGVIKENAKTNEGKINEVKILAQNNNGDSKVATQAIDKLLPINFMTLANHFADIEGIDDILRNEVSGIEPTLQAGETKVIDGITYTGHKLFGIPGYHLPVGHKDKTGEFGERWNPDKGTWVTEFEDGGFSYWGVGQMTRNPTQKEPHFGIDLGTGGKEGVQTAFAITNGTVIENEFNFAHDKAKKYDKDPSPYGTVLTIRDNDSGAIYRFAHMADINPELTVGSSYNGQIIGTIGSTGRSIGGNPHIHFEKIVDGVAMDPIDDVSKISMGNRISKGETFVGKYPIRRNLVMPFARQALGMKMSIKDFEKNEKAQKAVWNWMNEKSWPIAIKAANGDVHLGIRYHVAQLITGDMNNYTDATVMEYTDRYLYNLRTHGIGNQ